jgi:hypothetical protein
MVEYVVRAQAAGAAATITVRSEKGGVSRREVRLDGR